MFTVIFLIKTHSNLKTAFLARSLVFIVNSEFKFNISCSNTKLTHISTLDSNLTSELATLVFFIINGQL